jgi:hypothetical protein
MVRVTRFSFEDGMNVDFPCPRDVFDDDPDNSFDDESLSATTPRSSRRGKPWDCAKRPKTHRSDRRHLAGADWMTPAGGNDAPRQRSTPNAPGVLPEDAGE